VGRRLAIIIGNSIFRDSSLTRLLTPDADVGSLAEVLLDPEIGAFDDVKLLVNMSADTIRRSISRFFANKTRDDLLLLYFSGHGVLDEYGRLFLATKDTERSFLSGTAIPAGFITDEMDHSRSRRQVLVLDCCHSGAFARGSKGSTGASVGTASAFEGKGFGRVVLTASDATQYAWEGEQVIGEAENSVFTHYLIQGLQTGKADADGDGVITVDELYDYVYQQIVTQTPKQTPGKWTYKEQGEIVIARAPISPPSKAEQIEVPEIEDETEAKLKRLYESGLAAYWLEDWEKATWAFQAIVDIRPEYPGAADRLREARRRGDLASLSEKAVAALNSRNWDAAVTTLEALVAQDPNNEEALSQLRTAKEQKHLSELYTQARLLYQARKWYAAEKVMQKIRELAPNFDDEDGLQAKLEKQILEQERQKKIEGFYSQALSHVDRGEWQAARQCLQEVRALQPGYRQSERLLAKAESELQLGVEDDRYQEEISRRYHQASEAAKSGQWRTVLTIMEEIRGISPGFEDSDELYAQAQKEVKRQKDETRQQQELAQERLAEPAGQTITRYRNFLQNIRAHPALTITVSILLILSIGIGLSLLFPPAPGEPDNVQELTPQAAIVEEEPAEEMPTEEPLATEQPVSWVWTSRDITPLQFNSRLGLGRISKIAFNPRGDVLAVASSVGIRLYTADTFEFIQDLKATRNWSGGWLGSVTWSPDGTRLAGGDGGVIRVWDASSGKEIHAITGHDHFYGPGVSWSPDGAQLISYSWDETVRVWDADTGEELHRLKGMGSSDADWSPDGTRIAIAGGEVISVWDSTLSQEQLELTGHQESVWRVKWSPDGKRLASCGPDNSVRIWDADSGEQLFVLEGHTEPVDEISWSPDGTLLASSGYGSQAWVWNTNDGSVRFVTDDRGSSVDFLEWSPDGKSLALTHRDNTIGVWDVATGEESLRIRGEDGTWSPDGAQFVSGGRDGVVRVYDTFSGELLQEIDDYTGWMDSIAWSPDGTRLASGGGDKTIRIWDVASGNEVSRFKGHSSWVQSVAWSPDGTLLASGGWDDTVRIWDIAGGGELNTLAGHTGTVNSVAWSPDSTRLASGSEDNTIRIWDPASGTELNVLNNHTGSVTSVAWSPDGALLASGSEDKTIRIWDADTGEELMERQGHTETVASVAWSPDGSLVASGGWDDTVRVWDASSGEELKVLEHYRGYGVTWSPSGNSLAAVADNDLVVWDFADGQPYYSQWFTGGESVSWSPDGGQLAVGSGDGTVWVWDVIGE
jgi:WD40 repeat protein/tetratricopeptide (TPR) repeat protein